MNTNRISTTMWSNPDTEAAFHDGRMYAWPDDWGKHYRTCESCSFFAPLADSFGICCQADSEFYTESVLDEFTCKHHISEGQGIHSFSADPTRHCKCQGASRSVYEDLLARLNKRYEEWKAFREQGAAPNGGPATLLSNSGVTEGPPSVS